MRGCVLALGVALGACAPPPAAPPAGPTAPASAAPSSTALASTTASQPAPSAAPSSAAPAPAVAILPPGSPTQLAALNAAKAALEAGREKDAIAAFRTAMEGGMTGTSVSAAMAVADLLQAQGKGDEAAALYKQLMERARFVPEVQFAAGRFAWNRGDDATAQQALEAALYVQPDFLPAWQLLGLVQARAGKNTEAGRTLAEYELRLNRLVRHSADFSRPPGDRVAALEVLALLGDERSIQAVVAGLKDPEAAVRLAAAGLLVEENAPEALTGLAEAALAEREPELRAAMGGFLAQARRRAQKQTATPLPALPRPEGATPSGPPP